MVTEIPERYTKDCLSEGCGEAGQVQTNLDKFRPIWTSSDKFRPIPKKLPGELEGGAKWSLSGDASPLERYAEDRLSEGCGEAG